MPEASEHLSSELLVLPDITVGSLPKWIFGPCQRPGCSRAMEADLHREKDTGFLGAALVGDRSRSG